MTSNSASPAPTTHPDRPLRTERHFTMLFSSTRRGARLARRLAGQWLDTWGVPYDTTEHDEVTSIVAELAANAWQHGHVSGRDFRLALRTMSRTTVRVEVTDARAERLPVSLTPASDSTTGRGLVLVTALASRWGCLPRAGSPGKTVWAEYDLPATG